MSETSEPVGPGEGAKPAGRDLSMALRTARLQQAERSEVIVDLRAAEIARLELLRDEVAAVMRQVPTEHAALFDGGLVPGFPPRLWIDIVSFVEMGRDKRTYRFLRDGRQGRDTLAETTETAEMADKVMDYVAHRIIERERALSDETGGTAARAVQLGLPRPAPRPQAPPAPVAAPVALQRFETPSNEPSRRENPPQTRMGKPTRPSDEWSGAPFQAPPRAPEPAPPARSWGEARTQRAPGQPPVAQAFQPTGQAPYAPAFAEKTPETPAGWTTAHPGWSVDPIPQRQPAPEPAWGTPRLAGQGEFRRRRRFRITPFVTFLSGLLTGGVILGIAAWAIIGIGLGR